MNDLPSKSLCTRKKSHHHVYNITDFVKTTVSSPFLWIASSYFYKWTITLLKNCRECIFCSILIDRTHNATLLGFPFNLFLRQYLGGNCFARKGLIETNWMLLSLNRIRSRRSRQRAMTWWHGSGSWCPPAGKTCAASSKLLTRTDWALWMN